MSLRGTLVLALIFAALAGYLYFVELPRKTDDDETSALLRLDEASVSRIELEHPGRKVVLQKQDGAWQMLEPVAAPADQRSVENLIGAVGEARVKRTLEEAEELAVYGLDVPSATIRLEAGGESLGVIEVGRNAPVGGSVYVQRDDDGAVMLTDASFATRIDQQAADLRDKTILPFERGDVSWISIAAGADAAPLRMERDGDGWRITAPAAHAADRSAVSGLLSTLEALRAVDFLDEEGADLGRFGLDAPRRTLTLGLDDGEPLELRVGNEVEGKLRVQTNRRPTVYTVASWVADSVDKRPEHFRDKTVASFAPDTAAKVRITVPEGESLELSRTSDTWSAVGRDAAVDATAIAELLRVLSRLEGFEIAAELPPGGDLSPFGLAPPRRTLRVSDAGGEQLAAVSIGSHAADGATTEYAAMAVDAPNATVFHIREADYQSLDRGWEQLRARDDGSEGAAAPIPDGDTGDGVDENPFDDAAPAGE